MANKKRKTNRGGKRPGAGRPAAPDGRVIVAHSLPPDLAAWLAESAKDAGQSRSERLAKILRQAKGD